MTAGEEEAVGEWVAAEMAALEEKEGAEAIMAEAIMAVVDLVEDAVDDFKLRLPINPGDFPIWEGAEE